MTRSLDILSVLVLSKVAHFLKFYVLIIRQSLLDNLVVDGSETSRRHLLMDTRTGSILRSVQLRHTLLAIIENEEPRLSVYYTNTSWRELANLNAPEILGERNLYRY